MASRLFTPTSLISRSRILRPHQLLTPRLLARPTSRFYSTENPSTNNSNTKEDAKSEQQKRQERADKTGKPVWYNIPVGLGIAVVGGVYLYKVVARERRKDAEVVDEGSGARVRPTGPWQLTILSTLPLKALSRAWGYFNEIDLPVFLRDPGFRLYSWIFGANISEASESDLTAYRNLAEFFYRQLKPGARPIDESATIVSPSDGKVLHFGQVLPGGEVHNVKGLTYSLDALLGSEAKQLEEEVAAQVKEAKKESAGPWWKFGFGGKRGEHLREVGDLDADEEFAVVNGISYTLPGLLSGDKGKQGKKIATTEAVGEEVREVVEKVRSEVDGRGWWESVVGGDEKKALYFAVIYLAPGDYHRFHSPVNWVVERRRHFAGELLSVSPYLQNLLANLFVLNERVVLIGRWRHGLFTMTPVGATNVGSIKIHFDPELRTNSLTHDATAADVHPEEGYAEAVYKGVSKLGGYPLAKGQEMGGFNLGSTVVLVFEAPREGVEFLVKPGDTVRMGQALGNIVERK